MKRLKLICAALALCLILPLFPSCITLVERLPETTAPDYAPLDNADIKYLTSLEFNSDRTAGEVSEKFRNAAADFALRLVNESRGRYEGNGLLVSPLSVMLALAMTANGAQGETLKEMEDTIAGGMPIDELNQALFNYTHALISRPEAKFELANSIWVTSSPRFSINNNFVKLTENTFDADIIAVDMTDPATVNAINGWVKEKTDGMIDRIVENSDICYETVMVLLNALVFDAIWSKQVEDRFCYEDKWNGTQSATYMDTECDFYIKGNNETGIIKYYYGGSFAFVALLPDEDIKISDYLASLDGEDFLKLYDGKKKGMNTEITAKIPHFSTDCEINMNEALISMGMPTAFTSNADFYGLGSSTSGPISIEKVIHKAHLDLDNSGTRAAAVTAVLMYDGAVFGTPEKIRVELDRPFVYAIVDTLTGLPIFIGSCENIAE